MPELPEVETVRRTLAPAIGQVITSTWGSGKPLHMNRPVPYQAIDRFASRATIRDIRRHGKYLMLDLERRGSPAHVLLVHLGMTGRLRIHPAGAARGKHTHLVLGLRAPGTRRVSHELRYADIRRFGQLDLVTATAEAEHPALRILGRDPLVDPLDGAFVHEHACNSGQTLKAFLLNQRIIAGIGNIYASEALWIARIRPTLRARQLSRPRAATLAAAVTQVLNHALTHGGTSLKDFVAADGAQGSHSDYLQVYGRDGAPCPRNSCKGTVRRTVIQGRATFHCPRCQER